jgi:hypothetical protein
MIACLAGTTLLLCKEISLLRLTDTVVPFTTDWHCCDWGLDPDLWRPSFSELIPVGEWGPALLPPRPHPALFDSFCILKIPESYPGSNPA